MHAESAEQPSASGSAPSQPLRKPAVRGFVWSVATFGGNKLLVFTSTLVLTRLLTPADFGTVAAALAYMSYLEIILDLGLGTALIYRQEEGHPAAVSTAFSLNFGTCLLLAGVNLACAPLLAGFFQVRDANLFRVLSVYIVLRSVGGLQASLLTRDLRFRDKGMADLARALVRGLLGVALAFAGLGVWALVWAFLAAEVAGTLTSSIMTRFRPSLRFDAPTARSLLRYGAPVVALALLSELGVNSDYFVVGHVLGPVALGLYTIAFRLPELLLSNVYWMFSSVAFPIMSRARTDGPTVFRDSALKTLRVLTLFAFPVAVGLALVSRDAILVLFSDRWSGAALPMVLISLTIGLGCVGYASGDAYKAAGRPGTLLWINAVHTCAMIPAFILAAPHGIVAVAAVHLAANVIYANVRLWLANRLLGTTAGDVVGAMRPALCVTGGIVALALPVRFLAGPGLATLLAVVAAGIVGAGIGLLCSGRDTVRELRTLAGEFRPGR